MSNGHQFFPPISTCTMIHTSRHWWNVLAHLYITNEVPRLRRDFVRMRLDSSCATWVSTQSQQNFNNISQHYTETWYVIQQFNIALNNSPYNPTQSDLQNLQMLFGVHLFGLVSSVYGHTFFFHFCWLRQQITAFVCTRVVFWFLSGYSVSKTLFSVEQNMRFAFYPIPRTLEPISIHFGSKSRAFHRIATEMCVLF